MSSVWDPLRGISMHYAPALLVGGPMHGYFVPRDWWQHEKDWSPLMCFPIYTTPRVFVALYFQTTRVRREFVRDVAIYEYIGSSQ